jgi:hypothetical protein
VQFCARDLQNFSRFGEFVAMLWIRNYLSGSGLNFNFRIRIVYETYISTADLQIILISQKAEFLKSVLFWIRIVDEKYM